jgi:hypothetical protein
MTIHRKQSSDHAETQPETGPCWPASHGTLFSAAISHHRVPRSAPELPIRASRRHPPIRSLSCLIQHRRSDRLSIQDICHPHAPQLAVMATRRALQRLLGLPAGIVPAEGAGAPVFRWQSLYQHTHPTAPPQSRPFSAFQPSRLYPKQYYKTPEDYAFWGIIGLNFAGMLATKTDVPGLRDQLLQHCRASVDALYSGRLHTLLTSSVVHTSAWHCAANLAFLAFYRRTVRLTAREVGRRRRRPPRPGVALTRAAVRLEARSGAVRGPPAPGAEPAHLCAACCCSCCCCTCWAPWGARWRTPPSTGGTRQVGGGRQRRGRRRAPAPGPCARDVLRCLPGRAWAAAAPLAPGAAPAGRSLGRSPPLRPSTPPPLAHTQRTPSLQGLSWGRRTRSTRLRCWAAEGAYRPCSPTSSSSSRPPRRCCSSCRCRCCSGSLCSSSLRSRSRCVGVWVCVWEGRFCGAVLNRPVCCFIA